MLTKKALNEKYEIDLGMSNFDHQIDAGLEAALRKKPNVSWGRHTAWNFNGKVWYDAEQFHEEVWVYRVPRETLSANTLEELMTKVNEKYGVE